MVLLGIVVLLSASSPMAAAAPAPPEVQSATDLGAVQQSSKVTGRDAAYSVNMDGIGASGTSAWVFGDTTLNVNGADCEKFADNTRAFSGRGDASAGITLGFDDADSAGTPTEFLPITLGERFYNAAHATKHCELQPCTVRFNDACDARYTLWPNQPVADPARRRVLWFFLKIFRGKLPGETFGARTMGSGVAVSTGGASPVERVNQSNPTLYNHTQLFGEGSAPDDNPKLAERYSGLLFGDGNFLDRDGYVYSYDCQGIDRRCKLARVAAADATTRAAWRFYDGASNSWSEDSARATFLPELEGGPGGMTVSYNAYLGKYVSFSQFPAKERGNLFVDSVQYRVADRPEGPWSAVGILPFTQALPDTCSDKCFGNYATHEHPEFAQQSGKTTFITYLHGRGPGIVRLVRVTFR